ncbi:hypothetical protein [Chryseobacterium balustinum]|uniref:Uncharacterized protein n=1 Tax=Chryseobacterium balustinum TaxID=246 RepID=A0AAX2IRS5_9FLAO|nr:hypothetical protein [Chryseobacterium balustinum]SKB90213.1 hypothetical protein SAMN05421800_11380 [Chryseobacterium balustinum]SQA92319.1 Uncharacterised protein [Chryseobacterium balustinum]
MTTKQTNRLEMAKTLKQLFSVEQTAYAENNPLTARVAELNTLIGNIDGIAGIQNIDTTANTSLKTNAKARMINLTVAYANTAADFFDGKDSPLAKQLTASKSKIQRLSGIEAKIYCDKLYRLVAGNEVNLNPDYVTTVEMQEWQNAITNFDAKAYDAGLSIDTTQNATRELDEEFKKLKQCIAKIDRLMKKYDILDLSFYGKFKISRKISDLGIRHENELPPEQV